MTSRTGHVREIQAFAIILAFLLLAICPAAHADDAWREAGRKLLKEKGDALIRVEVVVSMGQGAGDSEQKIQAVGCAVSPEGLTVVPLSTIDPMSTVNRLAGPGMEMMMGLGATRVKNVQFYIDQKPVPATVVLRDTDLNMAFLRPREKLAKPLTALNLKDAAKPQILDQVLIISRLGSVANRELSLTSTYIKSVINKPRTCYVANEGLPSFGAPAFDLNGKLIGISLLRLGGGGPDAIGAAFMSLNFNELGLLPVILPAEDIQEVAEQAATAAAETPAPEPVKKDGETSDTEASDTETTETE